MKKLIAYSADAKGRAKQIVHEQFDEVLCGTFKVPSSKEMEHFLKGVIAYEFDEYKEMKRIAVIHSSWSSVQVRDEFQRRKTKYENEYQTKLRHASFEAINEVENLVGSLRDAIRAWKVKNLK